MFRKPKWSTSRWRLPTTLRRERLRELMAKEDLNELFGWDFIEGLEKRKEILERQQWKLFAIIAPVFLFLAFSLLNLDVRISVLGISAQASKNLREILLLIVGTFGVGATMVNRDLQFIKEMIRAVVEKQAQGKAELEEFLEQRYGLSQFSSMNSFNSDLVVGNIQKFGSAILVLSMLAWLGMIAAIIFAVQALNLIEVYYHPNVRPAAAVFVIAYVLVGDIIAFLSWVLGHSFQPYQSYEDLKKLTKLSETDEVKFKAVINEMVKKHYSRGFLTRIFGRPKLNRL